MPPRKSLQSSAGGTPQASSTQPRSAAHEAYSMPELRQRVLSLLSKHDLTRFMRVEKKVMADVARELYRSMPYAHVKNKMTTSTPRQRTYCAAVVEIDARSITLSPAMMKGIDIGSSVKGKAYNIQGYLLRYHAEVLELLIPILQKKCTNLRTINFGTDGHGQARDAWVVHLTPDRTGTGHVVHFRNFASLTPPKPLDPPPPPSGFTLAQYYDLQLQTHVTSGIGKPPWATPWLEALRAPTAFALGKVVHFGELPVSLDLISALYSRQIEAKSECRLQSVAAPYVSPYNTAEFTSFAKIAFTSLTTLQLASYYSANDPSSQPSLSFADIPDLTHVVRHHLPNLLELSIPLRGVWEAETTCKDLLSRDCLMAGGSITSLHVYTDRHSSQLFNTLRCISPLVDAEAKSFVVAVCHVSALRQKDPIDVCQTAYLKNLRRQSSVRREHLAVTDLLSLGISTLSEVSELAYRDDGSVLSKAESQASRWAEEAQESAGRIPRYNIPRLVTAIQTTAESSARLDALMATGEPAELLEEAQKLLRAVNDIRWEGSVLLGSFGGKRTEKEIRELVDSLKRTVGST